MTDLAHLGLAIDTAPVARAVSDLDRLTDSATRTERATDALNASSDSLVAALRENTSATAALTARMNDMQAGASRAQGAMQGVSTSATTAAGGVTALGRATSQTEAGLDAMAATTRRAGDGWAAFGRQGASAYAEIRTAQARTEANARASAALGGLGGSGGATPEAANENGQNGRLSGNQAQNLLYQGTDIVASAASGMSPLTIALQQFGQVVPNFTGPDGASLKGVFSQVTEGAGALASRIGLVGGALGGLTAIVGVGAAAWLSYRTAQDEVEKRLTGIGRLSGVTADQINTIGDAQASGGDMSRGAARGIASIYAGTGRVRGDALGEAVAATRDFSAFLGVDQAEGATALASALSDVSRGAGDLASKYGLLNAATLESVERLAAQGDQLGAARRLIDAVRDGTRGLAEETTGWGRAVDWLSNNWTALGQSIDRVLTGGTLDERLAAARKKLEKARAGAGTVELKFSSDDFDAGRRAPNLEAATKNFEDIQKQVDARDRASEEANRALRSQQVNAAVQSLDPTRQELVRLTDQATLLRKALSDPIHFGLDSFALIQVESAFGRASRVIQGMKDDIEKFGSSATAALNRSADFESKLVGATPYGRSAAKIREDYEEGLKKDSIAPTGPSLSTVEAAYRSRNQDFNVDQSSAYAQYAEERRQAAEREGRARARDVQLDNLSRTEQLGLNQRGGAYSRLTPEVRAQVDAGATRFPRIPANVLAALAEIESNGNLDVGYTKVLDENGKRGTAYGLGQITRTTGNELFQRYGIDRMNRATMGEAMAGVLDMKLDAPGVKGDLDRAIMAYRGSRNQGVNLSYLADARRKSGEAGDASVAGLARDYDANNRAVTQAQDSLKNVEQNYGRNTAAMQANARAQEQYRDIIARGATEAEAAAIAFGGMREKIVALEQSAQFVRFSRDDDFAREQLGRTRIDQQAYATARPFLGSDKYQDVLDRSRSTAELYETKAMLTDGATSFVTAMRRGTDATTALSNAFGSAADRFLAKTMDGVVSNLVGGVANSAAGDGGWISKAISSAKGAFGAADGYVPGYANGFVPRYADGVVSSVSSAGIVSGPGGPRDDRVPAMISPKEAIIRASSVERYGVDFIKRINEGTAPRDIASYARDGGWRSSAPRFADGMVPTAPARDLYTTYRSGSSAQAVPPVTAEVRVINEFSGAQVTKRSKPDGRGGRREEVVIREAAVSGVTSPQGMSALRSSQRLATG